MTRSPGPHAPPAPPRGFRGWWERHGGVDGGIRVGGAVAVVVTIELLAGYFLWRGMTELIRVPDVLGWTLQAGLAGGSAVGTRAFHRGEAEDKWWGLAASVFAVLCLVLDASVFALQLFGLLAINPGALAVGVLVECLVVGYLTVHTLMARPRVAAPLLEDAEWGPAVEAEEQSAPEPLAPVEAAPVLEPTEPAPEPTPPPKPRTPARRAPSRAAKPTKPAVRAVSGVPGKPLTSTQRLRARARAVGVPYNGRTRDTDLRPRVEAAEARESAARRADDEPEPVAA